MITSIDTKFFYSIFGQHSHVFEIVTLENSVASTLAEMVVHIELF